MPSQQSSLSGMRTALTAWPVPPDLSQVSREGTIVPAYDRESPADPESELMKPSPCTQADSVRGRAPPSRWTTCPFPLTNWSPETWIDRPEDPDGAGATVVVVVAGATVVVVVG